MQFYFLFKLSNISLSVYPFSLALPIKSALFASALVLALSGHGLLLAQSRTLQHDRGPSSCRSARSEVVVLWKTKATGKQLSMTAARMMPTMNCRAAVGLGLHRVDHGFSRSPPDRRKLWSTSKEKTTEEKNSRRCRRRRCRRRCRRPSRTAQEVVLQLLGNHGPTRTVGPLHQSRAAPSKLWRDIGL